MLIANDGCCVMFFLNDCCCCCCGCCCCCCCCVDGHFETQQIQITSNKNINNDISVDLLKVETGRIPAMFGVEFQTVMACCCSFSVCDTLGCAIYVCRARHRKQTHNQQNNRQQQINRQTNK